MLRGVMNPSSVQMDCRTTQGSDDEETLMKQSNPTCLRIRQYQKKKKLIRGCPSYARYSVPFGPNDLCRMQITHGTTRRTHHGASRLVVESLVRRKPGVIRRGRVRMRRQCSYCYDMRGQKYHPPREQECSYQYKTHTPYSILMFRGR